MNKLLHTDLSTLDYTELLKLARRIDRNKADYEGALPLKVAVLGSKNTQFFTQILKVLLVSANFDPILYEGEYDSIAHELFSENSGLYVFKPEILILLPDSSDIRRYPAILDPDQQVDELVEETADFYLKGWEKVLSKVPCTILQANFVLGFENALDQMEFNVGYSKTVFLTKLNLALLTHKPKQVHLIDENTMASEIGKRFWFDPVNDILNKAPYAYACLPQVTSLYLRKILSVRGLYRKVLVLDLDNTIWGGVIGDDGVEGINLDPSTALGEAFITFQHTILDLKAKGVILAVCSKNDEKIAKEGFSHPNMILKLSDIACFIANWQDKANNLKTIAKSLNVKTDALVFFDDNPAERSIVSSYCPEVLVIDVPEDPALYRRALYDAHPFDWSQITQEDLLRNNAIEEDIKRDQLRTQFVDYEAYLKSLEMVAVAGMISPHQIERFVQLTNKSNQFNLRTQRYTEADVMSMIQDPDKVLLAIDLSDRFSPYGIIACIVLTFNNDVAFIENWAMSCRVLNRGVEDLTIALCVEISKARNCTLLTGEYLSTSKNSLVQDLYDRLGFTIHQDGKYVLDLKTYIPRPCAITLKEKL